MNRRLLLLDQMLDEEVAEALRDLGHDVVRVSAVGLQGADDDMVVVPVAYTFLDDIGGAFGRWWRRGTPAHAVINHRVPEVVE